MVESNIGNVTVSERYLETRITALKAKVEEYTAKFVLTADMAEVQPFESEFCCAICYNVVKKPMQCKECDRLQCGTCLEKWWERAAIKKCPLCSKSTGFHNRVNNIVMNWLNAKTFKCSLCAALFTYDKFENHMRKVCELAQFRPDCELCGKSDF